MDIFPFTWTSDKKSWNEEEIVEFERTVFNYMGREEEILREKRIVNTALDCYAIPSKTIDDLVNLILDGNYIEFLEKSKNTTHPLTIIRGKIIANIEDRELFKKFLDDYSLNIDSWAHCDIFKVKINKLTHNFVANNVILDYLNSPNIFRRRIAIVLLLKHFLNNKDELSFTFDCVYSLANETEFYVYTAIAWLLCECYIKNQELTLMFLNNHKLNDLIIKKFISKCKESSRINKSNLEKLQFLK